MKLALVCRYQANFWSYSVSPFATLLRSLRTQKGVRQVDLAEKLGYEQTYISALEVDKKGPPPPEFIERFVSAYHLSEQDRRDLLEAADASERKLVIREDVPAEVYLLLRDLREKRPHLCSKKAQVLRDILGMEPTARTPVENSQRRIRRRRKAEATM